ncbi:MAG: hypothetical protein ACE5LU_22210, partial [Anaerolineae bacterium]
AVVGTDYNELGAIPMTSKHEHQRRQSSGRPAAPPQTAEEPSVSSGATARRKHYVRPAIIHELALETLAGSPLGIPDPFDPFNLEPEQ